MSRTWHLNSSCAMKNTDRPKRSFKILHLSKWRRPKEVLSRLEWNNKQNYTTDKDYILHTPSELTSTRARHTLTAQKHLRARIKGTHTKALYLQGSHSPIYTQYSQAPYSHSTLSPPKVFTPFSTLIGVRVIKCRQGGDLPDLTLLHTSSKPHLCHQRQPSSTSLPPFLELSSVGRQGCDLQVTSRHFTLLHTSSKPSLIVISTGDSG